MNQSTTTNRVAAFPWRWVALAAITVGVLSFLGSKAAGLAPRFAAWIDALGWWGAAAFVAAYAAATVAFIPGSLLSLAAGALYGLTRGTAIVLFGATLGASLAFLVARYSARKPVEQKLQHSKWFAAIDRAVAENGRKIVALLRLSPVVPFNLLNYALGLTRVRFVDYFVASIFMLPGILLYVYYGKVAGDVASLVGAPNTADRGPGYYALTVLGLVATVIATRIVTKSAQTAFCATVRESGSSEPGLAQ